MAKNLEGYTPQEIVTQENTLEPLEPPKKISPEIKPDKNTNIPESQPTPQTENQVEQKPLLDPGEIKRANKELKRAKEELKKMWIPEDIKERKDLLEENKPTPASEPKLEIVENFGRRKTEEELAEKAKFEKDLEREKDIKEKQKRGEYLSTGDFAFKKGKENRRELSKMAVKSGEENTEKSVPEKVAPEKESEKKPEEFDLSSTEINTINAGEVSEEFSARTKELQQEQIKTAKAGLEAQLQAINEAREKKDWAAEHSALKEAEKLFEITEGKKLAEEAVKRADVEIKQERLVRMSREQYEQKYAKRAEGQAEQIKKTNILEKRFAALSEQEKSKYAGENGLENFSKDMDAKIETKRAELEKEGIVISKNAFYAMMEEGLNPEEVKTSGWFSKKIEITHKSLIAGRKGISEKLSKDDFLKMAKQSEESFVSGIKKQAEAVLAHEIKIGQDIWKAKKNKCMRNAIEDAIGEKQPKPEIEKSKPEQTEAEKKPEIDQAINIEGASSLEELYKVLEGAKKIQGSRGIEYSAKDMIENIAFIAEISPKLIEDGYKRKGLVESRLFTFIPESLRKKVEQLVFEPKESEKGAEKSKKPLSAREKAQKKLIKSMLKDGEKLTGPQEKFLEKHMPAEYKKYKEKPAE